MRLAKHHQLYRNEPENGIPGDCWRTAIGCLLGLPPHKVPHFLLEAWKGGGTMEQVGQRWLRAQGYTLLGLPFAGHLDALYDTMSTNPDVVYLLSGKSPRGNWSHVVIAQRCEIIWDPAPEGSKGWGKLDGPCEDGYYWIEVLVPLMETTR